MGEKKRLRREAKRLGITVEELMHTLPQLSLPPAQHHSSTSTGAAREIAPRTPSMRLQVLEELRRAPGSDQQLAMRLGWSENSVRPRRVELERQELVERHVKVRTTSGRLAWSWRVVGHVYPISE